MAPYAYNLPPWVTLNGAELIPLISEPAHIRTPSSPDVYAVKPAATVPPLDTTKVPFVVTPPSRIDLVLS